ncbi:MAG TPA: hypothetical protein VGN09_18650 [Vicinamibacteria bacterium]
MTPALRVVVLVLSSSALAPAATVTGSLESGPGFHVATFPLPAGTIYVNLCDDLAPGDTASATVNPVPAATSASDEARLRQELDAFSVEIGGQRAPVSVGVRTFTIPAGATAITIWLVDPRGRPAAEVRAPLHAPAPAPSSYRVPDVGQAGGPVRIAGPFDGDLSDSVVRIGGRPAQAMAESPRQLVVRGPEEPAPPAPIEVSERGSVVAAGTYRNVSVRLSAPVTNLLAGQHTTLTITVTGLEALQETLPVRLANRSPDVVRMEGGEEQTLCVRPDEVGTTGVWTKTRGLTGVHAGAFSIQTDLTRPGPGVESSAAVDATLHGELLARVELDRPARTAAGQALAAGPYQVVVRGTAERGKVRLFFWRDGKAAGTVDGAVLEQVSGAPICDRRDASDALSKATASSGDRGFDELGFAAGRAFTVRGGGGGLRLVLETAEGTFSIEASLTSA